MKRLDNQTVPATGGGAIGSANGRRLGTDGARVAGFGPDSDAAQEGAAATRAACGTTLALRISITDTPLSAGRP
ncbi:MAG TPA: hypothetical protein PLF63_08145 [Rubrivivax sp.]|jgi:NADP-dependent 3-hydroxy acid dehydrogenase YdfG|nr:hypothetical protein [Rubrivivax sp.]